MKLNYDAFQGWANNILSKFKLSETNISDIQYKYQNIFDAADVLDNEASILNDNEQELAQDYIENAINFAKGEREKINYSRKEFGVVSAEQSYKVFTSTRDRATYNKSVYDSAIANLNCENIKLSKVIYSDIASHNLRTPEELYNDTVHLRDVLSKKLKSLGYDTSYLDSQPIQKPTTDAGTQERYYDKAVRENSKLISEYQGELLYIEKEKIKKELENQSIIIENLDEQYPITEQNIDSSDFGDIEQGNVGNCTILAALKSAMTTKEGTRKIHQMLKIEKNNDGSLKSITVTIQGQEFLFNADELYNDKEYSKGDIRIKAIEMAVDKWVKDNNLYDYDYVYVEDASNAFHILFGDAKDIKKEHEVNKADKNYIFSLQNNPNMRGTAELARNSSYFAYTTDNNEKVSILKGHQYAVLGADSEFVYLRNPHNTSIPLKMPINEFIECFEDTALFDFSS